MIYQRPPQPPAPGKPRRPRAPHRPRATPLAIPLAIPLATPAATRAAIPAATRAAIPAATPIPAMTARCARRRPRAGTFQTMRGSMRMQRMPRSPAIRRRSRRGWSARWAPVAGARGRCGSTSVWWWSMPRRGRPSAALRRCLATTTSRTVTPPRCRCRRAGMSRITRMRHPIPTHRGRA